MPSQQNTYRKLDRDTAKNKVDKESMYECRNFRLIGDNPNESGALINILGNERLSLGFDGHFYDVVIGSKQIRDKVVLITAMSTSATPVGQSGRIWTWDFQNDSAPVLIYNGTLNLSRAHPIGDNIIARYENDELQKVYWADGYNFLRGCNIADPDLASKDPDDFNIVNDVDFNAPEFVRLLSGNIPVGRVQYAYRLYKKHGPQTTFSPASKMINLTTANENSATTARYGGADRLDDDGEALSSGKAVSMTISDVDTNYDRIEIVAIHYYDILSAPNIWIVQTSDVSSVVNFTDSGDYGQGFYSIGEYTALSNLFTPKHISTKNNIMFAGDVTTEEFDVDYDARAYRFASNGHAYVNDDGQYYYIDWSSYPTAPTISGYGGAPVITSLAEIAPDWNCTQDVNDITVDPGGTGQIYQGDGSTLGGEGVNVSYTFKTTDYLIDDSNDPQSFHVSGSAVPYYWPSYASPYNSGNLLGYQKDEIYRFGVVLFSTKGQPSPVKIIGDIRTPSNSHTVGGSDNRLSYSTGGDHYGRRLYLEFSLDNLPDGVSGYQIVRVERKPEDRTVLFQGRMANTETWGGRHQPVRPNVGTAGDYESHSGSTDNRKRNIWVNAPEISFYKDYKAAAGDFVQVIGYYGTKEQTNYGVDDWHTVNKYTGFTPLVYGAIYRQNINDGTVVETNPSPDEEVGNFTFAGIPYNNVVRRIVNLIDPLFQNSNAGTAAFLQLPFALNLSALPSSSWPVVSYRRPVTQYGGNSYEAKLTNKYIPASDYIPKTSDYMTNDCYGGDTYISMFDCLYSYYNAFYAADDNSDTAAYVDLFPVETTINMDLRHDDCWHRISSNDTSKYYLKEVGNAEFTVGETIYTPSWSDLYLYNTVFSRQENARLYIPVDADYDLINESDAMVMASNAKLNGEEVDAWSVWPLNESLELDGGHGPITGLVAWNNNILFFQEKAFGTLSILERSLIQDSEGRNVTLGEGDVLQRYDIISSETGISTRGSIVVTPSSVVWFDDKQKRMYRLSKNLDNMGILKGMNSYFSSIPTAVSVNDNTLNGTYGGFQLVYNSKFNEIWFTVKSGINTTESLVFNEILDNYTLFIDNTLAMGYIKQDDILLSHTLYGQIYEENSTNVPRGELYQVIRDAVVEVIVNPMGNLVHTLTNLEFTTEIVDSSDNNVVDETLSSVQVINDYQDTGVITLVPGTNVRRLLRTWRINTLRDAAYEARLRDSYSKVRMTYTNSSGSPRKIILHDLISVYTMPTETLVNKK